jgi:hypothetical protein
MAWMSWSPAVYDLTISIRRTAYDTGEVERKGVPGSLSLSTPNGKKWTFLLIHHIIGDTIDSAI